MRRIRVRRAHRAGVRAIVTSGVSPADWSDALKLAGEITSAQHAPRIYCALGLHPYAVSPDMETNRNALDRLKTLLELELASRAGTGDHANAQDKASDKKLLALGECGLDFRKNMPFASQQIQLDALREQLGLASQLGLPCVLHCVKAHGPLLEVLQEQALVPSVMHAFSGSAEMAARFTKSGHYLSFAGNVTRADAKRAHQSATACPPDQLLVESDSPDQTPQTRGALPNEPAFIVDIVAQLAHLRGESMAVLAQQTMRNACRVYGLPEPSEVQT